MVNFNNEFRLNVVLEYLSGIGSNTLCHKYGIADDSTILLWVNRYEAYGLNGLIVRSPVKVYPGPYKVKVLNWMKLHRQSYPKTALHFNISAPATIFS